MECLSKRIWCRECVKEMDKIFNQVHSKCKRQFHLLFFLSNRPNWEIHKYLLITTNTDIFITSIYRFLIVLTHILAIQEERLSFNLNRSFIFFLAKNGKFYVCIRRRTLWWIIGWKYQTWKWYMCWLPCIWFKRKIIYWQMYTQEAAVCHFDNDHKSKYINCLREIHYIFRWSLHDMFELMATRVYCHPFLRGIQL